MINLLFMLGVSILWEIIVFLVSYFMKPNSVKFNSIQFIFPQNNEHI